MKTDSGNIKINKGDVLWNYLATFLKIASSLLLMPFILRHLAAEEIGVWVVFTTIGSLVFLLDFGFTSSFSRTVSFVFAGAKTLKSKGYDFQENCFDQHIDYGLLKGVIGAMKLIYGYLSLGLLFILASGGTYYLFNLLKGYGGSRIMVYISWGVFCLLNAYSFYTLYYESLLIGRGFIKESKKIIIIGQLFYLTIAVITIYIGGGLLGIVLGQLFSIIYVRMKSRLLFFDNSIVLSLKNVRNYDVDKVVKSVTPNALRYGLTSFGGFLIQKSSILMGSFYLPLATIASFGIAKQIIDVCTSLSTIFVMTYIPKIVSLRISNDSASIKQLYLKSSIIGSFLMAFSCLTFVFFGKEILFYLNSRTVFPTKDVLLALSFSAIIAINCNIAATVISTRNEIPFLKASLLSGLGNLLLLWFFFEYTNLALLGMAFAPGIIDLCYQGWKWPLYVFRELGIKFSDFRTLFVKLLRNGGSI